MCFISYTVRVYQRNHRERDKCSSFVWISLENKQSPWTRSWKSRLHVVGGRIRTRYIGNNFVRIATKQRKKTLYYYVVYSAHFQTDECDSEDVARPLYTFMCILSFVQRVIAPLVWTSKVSIGSRTHFLSLKTQYGVVYFRSRDFWALAVRLLTTNGRDLSFGPLTYFTALALRIPTVGEWETVGVMFLNLIDAFRLLPLARCRPYVFGQRDWGFNKPVPSNILSINHTKQKYMCMLKLL